MAENSEYEGIMLGLGALAEVLQKMDARLEKADEEEEEEKRMVDEKEEKEDAEVEKSELIKAISGEVIAALKQGGLDLDAKGEKKVSGKDAWPVKGGGEDESKKVELRTETKEVQKPIQAAELVEKADSHPEGCMCEPCKEDRKKDEKPPEYPMEEGVEKSEVITLSKQIIELKKSLDAKDKNFEKVVDAALSKKLAQLGYREEKSLAAPKLTNILGAGTVEIKKSDETASASSEDVTDQMAKMSWRDINKLRFDDETRKKVLGV